MKLFLLALILMLPLRRFTPSHYNFDFEQLDSAAGQPANNAAPATDELQWLKKRAMPLRTVDAGHGSKDLQGLKPLIGDARIVSLGECTHGTSEIFRMKHRLLEFLVTEMGFTIFSIEANLPECNAINEYVLHGKGDPHKALDGIYFWTWNTQEVLDMIKWMRAYNIKHPKKMVQFTGFDMQFSAGACATLGKFAAHYAPALKPLTDTIQNYSAQLSAQNTKMLKDGYRNLLQKKVDELADDFRKNSKVYRQKAGDSTVEWALQNIVVLQQFNALHASASNLPVRDESMAKNVIWLANRYPKQKIVLWAHNDHVGRHAWTMGGFLDRAFKEKMVVLGFAATAGTYTAVKRGEGVKRDNVLFPPVPRSFESYAQASSIGNFILDTRKNTLKEAGSSWLLAPRKIRSIGALAMDGGDQFSKEVLPDIFDAIIYLENTTASKAVKTR